MPEPCNNDMEIMAYSNMRYLFANNEQKIYPEKYDWLKSIITVMIAMFMVSGVSGIRFNS